MFRRNQAAAVPFLLVNASTGAALTGATVTVRRALDAAAQAATTGTVAELGNGQYRFDGVAADFDGSVVGLLFTATGAIPVHVTIKTTAANPDDAVRLGLSGLPNAAAAAAGGLPVLDANSLIPTDVIRISGDATAADNLEADYDGTGYGGDTPGTTTLLERLTADRAGKLDNLDAAITTRATPAQVNSEVDTALADVGLTTTITARIDAAISSRSTYAGGDTAGTTTLLDRLTAIRAGLLDNLDAAVSTRSTYAGTDTPGTGTLLGRLTAERAGLLDNLDAAISTRSTYAGGDTPGTATLLGRIPGTVQPQSGDSYARLGIPASGSIAGDILAVAGFVDTEIGTIVTNTNTILGRLTADRATKLDFLDAAITSRLADADYAAPDNVTITTIAGVVGDLESRLSAERAEVLSHLATMIEIDGEGPAQKWTAAALADAPTGGLTSQEVRDAVLLAPREDYAEAAGSIGQIFSGEPKTLEDFAIAMWTTTGVDRVLTGFGFPTVLAPEGLDNVMVEVAANVRQALQVILAGVNGRSLGVETNNPVVSNYLGTSERYRLVTDAAGNRLSSAITVDP